MAGNSSHYYIKHKMLPAVLGMTDFVIRRHNYIYRYCCYKYRVTPVGVCLPLCSDEKKAYVINLPLTGHTLTTTVTTQYDNNMLP